MNITFQNSFFLYFLPIAILPIIIYFFVKGRKIKNTITYLPFINTAKKRIIKFGRLRTFLLLLLRVLILTNVILLFASPLSIPYGSKTQGKKTVILIDNSLSMRAISENKSLLEYAKEISYEIITLKDENENLAVLSFTDHIEKDVKFFQDKTELLKQVRQIQPTFEQTSITNVLLEIFKSIKRDDTDISKIFVISDF